MNINLNEQRNRVAELMMILNDIESTNSFFRELDPEYAKEETKNLTVKYSERLTDFFRVTMENANVIGDLNVQPTGDELDYINFPF